MAKAKTEAPTTDRLADIAEGWDQFEKACIDAEGVLDEALAAQHEALQLRERHKVDGLALYVQSLGVQAEGLEQMAKAIAAKATTLRNRQKWLKDYVGRYLDARGLEEVQGDLGFTAKWVGNGGVLPLEIVETNPACFPIACRKQVIDEAAVRSHLKEPGQELVEGGTVLARLLPRGRHVRIG